MDNVPRSKEFDDVYFSVQDGLEETRHVFLKGNNLRERWSGGEVGHFTICETGFGTGLNFLAALNLWREVGAKGRLEFISFEKFPVTRDFIREHLSHWSEISEELDLLLANYPLELGSGIHSLTIADDVRLTLIFGDVNEEIPHIKLKDQHPAILSQHPRDLPKHPRTFLQHSRENGNPHRLDPRFRGDADKVVISLADCWFLDGFKPSSNPEMWSETVFQNMARLSCGDATFATFTSAGFVRRGLASAGFQVQKIAGFGRKREMSVGLYKPQFS